MDEQKKNNEQEPQAGQNPTLNDKGTRVPDYGNVMGGSSSGSQEQGQRPEQGNPERGGTNDTKGNP